MADEVEKREIIQVTPEIMGACGDSPDEVDHFLGKRARKAINYVIKKLEPLGFSGEDAKELLERVVAPLVKATHSKDASWKERLLASRMLGELVGLYMTSERRNGQPLTQQITVNVITGVPRPEEQLARVEVLEKLPE